MIKTNILKASACVVVLMMTMMAVNVYPAGASLTATGTGIAGVVPTCPILIGPAALDWVISAAKKTMGYKTDENDKRSQRAISRYEQFRHIILRSPRSTGPVYVH